MGFLNLDGLALSATQGKWKRTAEKVAREVLLPNVAQTDRDAVFPRESVRALGQHGLLGLLIPADLGGAGESVVTAVHVTEALAKACPATAMAYHMHQSTIPLMSRLVNEAQRNAFMSKILSGGWFGAFAMSEPGSGNRIWHMDSYLQRDGDTLVLDSFKSFCTSAGEADFYLVPTRSGAGASPSDVAMLLVPGDTPGIKPVGVWDGLGLRGSNSRPIHFDHCRLSSLNLLGGETAGLSYMMSYSLPVYLCGMAAAYVGIAQAAYDAAVQHVMARVHTDTNRSLAHVETVQRIMAEMRISIDLVRSTVIRVAQMADNAYVLFDEFHSVDLLDSVIRDNPNDPFFIEVASLKPAACEMVIDVTNKAMQVCGGAGYKRGHVVERCYRDGRAGSVMGPSDDTTKVVIGTQILGLPQPWA